jgi:hypothetical protein
MSTENLNVVDSVEEKTTKPIIQMHTPEFFPWKILYSEEAVFGVVITMCEQSSTEDQKITNPMQTLSNPLHTFDIYAIGSNLYIRGWCRTRPIKLVQIKYDDVNSIFEGVNTIYRVWKGILGISDKRKKQREQLIYLRTLLTLLAFEIAFVYNVGDTPYDYLKEMDEIRDEVISKKIVIDNHFWKILTSDSEFATAWKEDRVATWPTTRLSWVQDKVNNEIAEREAIKEQNRQRVKEEARKRKEALALKKAEEEKSKKANDVKEEDGI